MQPSIADFSPTASVAEGDGPHEECTYRVDYIASDPKLGVLDAMSLLLPHISHKSWDKNSEESGFTSHVAHARNIERHGWMRSCIHSQSVAAPPVRVKRIMHLWVECRCGFFLTLHQILWSGRFWQRIKSDFFVLKMWCNYLFTNYMWLLRH